MKREKDYYIVEASSLPEVFLKTVEAKRILKSGAAKTVEEAVRAVGLSRSAFYKYRDSVSLFVETSAGSITTFHMLLDDRPGMLSSLLLLFARCGANILTINQSIPLNGQAIVTVSARTGGTEGFRELISAAQQMEGVARFEVLSGERASADGGRGVNRDALK